MQRLILVSALALGVSGCTYEGPPEPTPRAQAALAEALEGRVAEAPVSCVSQHNLGGNRSIGEGVILFGDLNRSIVYVNRPPAGCPELDSGKALITRTPSTRLCRGDIVQVADLVSGATYGGCGLGDFTPYRRVRD